jgi:hypothetical protein
MAFRLRVALIHLLISGLLAIAVALLVYGVWYPSPLPKAVDVTRIFIVILVVDLFIGPLCSFIVSKQGKKSLHWDLAIIGICQITALGYGVWIVAEGRPLWLVFNVDRVDLVQAYELDNPYTLTAAQEYRSMNWSGPKWVSARIPEDTEARNTLTFDAVFAGVDLPQRADLYVPFSDEAERMRSKALSLETLVQFNDADHVKKTLASWPDADAFLPLMGPDNSLTVLMNLEAGKVVAIVDLQPW